MKNKKGISMVSLVITIIALVILAGTVIITLVNGGIIGNAKEARDRHNRKQAYELVQREVLAVQMENPGKSILEIDEELQTKLRKTDPNAEVEKDTENNQLKIKYTLKGNKEPYRYILTDKYILLEEEAPQGEEDIIEVKPVYEFEEVCSNADDWIVQDEFGEKFSNGYWPEEDYNDREWTIVEYKGLNFEDVVIPNTLENELGEKIRITKVGDGVNPLIKTSTKRFKGTITISNGLYLEKKALYNRTRTDFTTIILGNNVQTCNLSEDDYYTMTIKCTSVTDIIIGNNCRIGDYTFYNLNDVSNITIGDWCSFGNYAFSESYNAQINGETGEVKNVEEIGYCAFQGCSGLKNVTISNNVTSIGEYAFCDCSSLTSVTISDSVTSIEYGAFCDCSSLTSVTIGNRVTSIGGYAFGECSSLTSVTIGNRVTNIENFAFQGCSGLKNVTIPNSVTSIGEYAFCDCSSLTSVTIPDSVTNIGYCAFSGCSSLTSVTIGNGVTNIENFAFQGCSGLKNVTIPNSVTIIINTFSDCSNLTSVTIKKVNDELSRSLVYLLEKCKGSVVIEEGITSIGYQAFFGCSGLTSVTIPNSVTSIGYQAFCGCSSLKSVTIGNGVTNIEDYAFQDCSGLASVTIGNGVTNIESRAFSGCGSLTSVTIKAVNSELSAANILVLARICKGNVVIEEGITSIGDYAFGNCSSLTSVTMPDSVTSIGKQAFSGCIDLTNINISNQNQNYFSENGIIYNKNKTKLIAYPSANGNVIIPNSVTSIEYAAFSNCSNLTSVTIPNSLTNIEEGAFWLCSGLSNVTIPNNVTSIGINAFYNVPKVTVTSQRVKDLVTASGYTGTIVGP